MERFRLFLPIFFVLLAEPFLFAQDRVTVRGTVRSAETGEALFGAYVLNGTGGARPLTKMVPILYRQFLEKRLSISI